MSIENIKPAFISEKELTTRRPAAVEIMPISWLA